MEDTIQTAAKSAARPKPDPKVKAKPSLTTILTTAMKAKDEGSICNNVTEMAFDENPPRFSSGFEMLDAILGGDVGDTSTTGGFEWGRMTEIFGPNKSGKTELVRRIASSVLTNDPDSHVWYFDQEFALDAKVMDSNPAFKLKTANGEKRFRALRASHLESFFATLYAALRQIAEQRKNGEKINLLIILDSVPALQSKQEVESEEFKGGSLLPTPRLWSAETSKLRRFMSHVGGHLLLVNQIRSKPGEMSFVEPESPGGQAIKFYSDYRIFINQSSGFSFTKGKSPAKGYQPSGFFTRLKIRKNKTGLPERVLEMPVIYQPHQGTPSGICHHWALFYALTSVKLIVAKGGKYFLRGDSEGFDRKDWKGLYDEQFSVAGSPLRNCFVLWVKTQLRSDLLEESDSSPDESDESEEQGE